MLRVAWFIEAALLASLVLHLGSLKRPCWLPWCFTLVHRSGLAGFLGASPWFFEAALLASLVLHLGSLKRPCWLPWCFTLVH
jgi:hypothetical protein